MRQERPGQPDEMSNDGQVSASAQRGLGLQARVSLAFCGLLFVFAAAAIMLEWSADRRQAREQAVMVMSDRAALVAAQVADAAAVSDCATLSTVANTAVEQNGTLGIRIVGAAACRDFPADRAGGLDAVLGRAMKDAARQGAGKALVDSRYIAVAHTIVRNGETVVTVALAGARAPLERGHGGSAVRLGLLFLGLLIVAAPVSMLLARALTGSLRAISDFVSELGEKQLSQRLPLLSVTGRMAEVADLAAACNQMADRLQQSFRRLQRMAYSDTATGLPNHERFARDVTDLLATRQDEIGAIFVVRLDRLDRIFDAIGQDAGDELLTRIVGRLTAAVRAIDRMVRTEVCGDRPSQLARLRGGDFGVLAPKLRGPEDAARFAQLLASALNQPFDWREHKLVLGAVIGAAILPQDGTDADTGIRHAMLAMAAAKSDTGKMKFFTKALDREANAALAFEREMRAAIDRNEFKAFFQPKIDLMTGRVIGAEALARWVKPDRTMVSPGRFIPAAEENGLIGAISEIILRDACWKAASWAREGFPLSVAINISPLQFADERFTDKITRAMAEAGISPNRVELEVTESVALENPERALRLLEPLRALGVKVSLDDFGCGHSSLASLTRLPFDIIKIDQQFVRALAKDRHAPAIIEMILAMAASLDYTVVAEGVETEAEAEFLRRRGCQIGQGFLYGAAMPAPEFLRFNLDRATAAAGIATARAG